MAFILITLTLEAVGFGLIMPVMPDLLREVTGGDLALAALWGGLLMGGYAFMQFLFGSQALTPAEGIIVVGAGVSVLLALELEKGARLLLARLRPA